MYGWSGEWMDDLLNSIVNREDYIYVHCLFLDLFKASYGIPCNL